MYPDNIHSNRVNYSLLFSLLTSHLHFLFLYFIFKVLFYLLPFLRHVKSLNVKLPMWNPSLIQICTFKAYMSYMTEYRFLLQKSYSNTQETSRSCSFKLRLFLRSKIYRNIIFWLLLKKLFYNTYLCYFYFVNFYCVKYNDYLISIYIQVLLNSLFKIINIITFEEIYFK